MLENIYRAVNIALVNELKTSVRFEWTSTSGKSINAAKTKPFGFQAFYPGPGLGGHCIPIDPFYLSWLARKQGLNARFIELAGEVNRSPCPQYVVSRTIRVPERVMQTDPRQQDLHAGRRLQEGRGRSARKPRVRADGIAAANAVPT